MTTEGSEALLPRLRRCLTDPVEMMAERESLAAALADELARGADGDGASSVVDALAELRGAADPATLSVVAAKTMRLLMQVSAAAQPIAEATPTRRSSAERRAARAERQQARALEQDRRAPAESPLERPVETLPGIGRVTGQSLRARGLATLADLIWCLPLGYRDERALTPIGALVEGAHAITVGRVASVRGGGRGRRMAEVVLCDEQGDEVRLVWFRAPGGLLKRFSEGTRFTAAGRVEAYRERLSINHPVTATLAEGEPAKGPGILPRYPEVIGVSPRLLDKALRAALAQACDHVPDAVPAELAEREGLPTLADALARLHAPPQDLDDDNLARWNAHASRYHRRLAFEEFFLLELALHHRQQSERDVRAESLQASEQQVQRVRAALGFQLTAAQARVCDEIARDLASDQPMRRLLQGDVGSGKTAVALLAAAHAVSAGAQVAFMAPTEVLAQQHFRSLGPLSEALGLRTALLLGGARASHRRSVLSDLANARLDLVIGTHALLSDSVAFSRLRLVIVDEQHRFGVAQRLRLVDKGEGRSPHLLVMTATPIPRTLTLALHGDLSTSVIDELPPGRVPPVTRAYPVAERARALRQVERALDQGGQAYVVCPAIEDTEDQPLRTVEVAYRELQERFPDEGVALLHGRLPPEDKQRAMDAFLHGKARVLVATTVIEVGVDVARANVILIEHAERFGMAQLHQLRGRVGRAGQNSACLLVHDAQGPEARRRIEVLCESHDGFRIAEEDLQLRGPGELFGRRQSGLPGFRFGDLRRDLELLDRAREGARALLESDPELAQPKHEGARDALARLQEGRNAVVREEAG
ncbi:MAG: ATP-dependent DNA helicase RecG [Myxococcales bacterium]|nr:ATP-dependent DNA helicase RecG [Myxococcales bacterium]